MWYDRFVGTESDEPVATDEALPQDLQMKECFDGKYRLLQNTTGMWIIQELQRLAFARKKFGFGEMVTLMKK